MRCGILEILRYVRLSFSLLAVMISASDLIENDTGWVALFSSLGSQYEQGARFITSK